jgi:hypothetical protein
MHGQRIRPASVDSSTAVVAHERMPSSGAYAVVLDFAASLAALARAATPEPGGPAAPAIAPKPAAGPPLQRRPPHYRVGVCRAAQLAAARAGRRDRKVTCVGTALGVAW